MNRIPGLTPIVVLCTTLIPLSLLGCGQSEFERLRLGEFERRIGHFYKSKTLTDELRVGEVSAGMALEGFCILSAYEDRVTPDSDGAIAVNAFLEKHQFLGREEYWHLILKTPDGLRVARFNAARLPLIAPRPAYEGKNCVATKLIIFSKKLVSVGGAPLLVGGLNTQVVVNVQPGD